MLKSKQIDFIENIDFSNLYKVINMVDPTNTYDAATKNYVDQATIVAWGDIIGDITNQIDLQYSLNSKKNYFVENTAFNKNFGSIPGTVAEGNHYHDRIIYSGGSFVRALINHISISHYVDMNSNLIINLSYPILLTDAANKKYVDDQIATIDQTGTQWGEITGTLSNQVDLQAALNNKSDITHNHSNNLATVIGYVPIWNSINGTIFGNGYSVDTVAISGASTALVTSELLNNALAAVTAVTASNGLTRAVNNIVLGGTLTTATIIAKASKPFTLNGLGSIVLSAGNTGVNTSSLAINQTSINLTATTSGSINSALNITQSAMIISDSINTKGLVYAADYSTNFTDRSLVDKEYVDILVGSIVGTSLIHYSNELPTVTNGDAAVSALNNLGSHATNKVANVEVYLNGIKQVPGGANDYTLVALTGVITFTFNLQTNDVVSVDYDKKNA